MMNILTYAHMFYIMRCFRDNGRLILNRNYLLSVCNRVHSVPSPVRVTLHTFRAINLERLLHQVSPEQYESLTCPLARHGCYEEPIESDRVTADT
jgi:hypothetical protein